MDIHAPMVSFCMTTYKRPALLKKTLHQLRGQVFRDFEVVISDNDPEASAGPVVRELQDPRFKYYHNEDNLGMIRSFNRSIERSAGKFIVMITDDDPVYPEMLQTLFDLYQQYPDYGVYMGGYDTFFGSLLLAKVSKARVGINSALADSEIGTVKKYTSEEFLPAFCKDAFGAGMHWSAAMVRRDIALEVGGFPEYGTPHLADCSYILLAGSRSGMVHINTSVCYRIIHGDNYSYVNANYDNIYNAPEGFYKWTMERLPVSLRTAGTEKALKDFIGRHMSYYVIVVKKMILNLHAGSEDFERFVHKFYKIPYLRRWRLKYYIAIHFPNLFEVFLATKRLIFPAAGNK